MTTESKVRWGVLIGAVLLGLYVLLSEKVEERVAPQPIRALIAIETDDDGVAKTGHAEIAPGTPFTLHAVVEAVDWAGKSVYYTEAQRLEIEGTEVPREQIRKWDRSLETRVLWFTVEGFKPFLDIATGGDLQQFHYQEFLKPSWPRTWSIPGSLQGSGDASLRQSALGDVPRFGTQHYHVRVEMFGPRSQITPVQRIQSVQADTLPGSAAELPTVVAVTPGRLEVPTSVFGITQIEPGSNAEPDVLEMLESWTASGLVFSRRTVLLGMLDRFDIAYEDLVWVDIDVAEGVDWGEDGVEEGDLLRVGERWVVLFADKGEPGSLDPQDLCLDFDKGPRVSQIGEVFTGDGLIEWASTSGLGE